LVLRNRPLFGWINFEALRTLETGRAKEYHGGNRLSGSAGFFNCGAYFFHLDFILAQHGIRTGPYRPFRRHPLSSNECRTFSYGDRNQAEAMVRAQEAPSHIPYSPGLYKKFYHSYK
jgi:hypothetical protein